MNRLVFTIALMAVFCAEGAFAAPEKGTMKDSRDGKTYKTVKIGKQTWMGSNLNYKIEDSFCYKGDETNCVKYGRLYTWKAAQKACPAGWHLPSKEDFEALVDAGGGEVVAGKKLKVSSGWDENGNGVDSFGFSALPAGTRVYDGDYIEEGENAYFWSSTEHSSHVALRMLLSYEFDLADLSNFDKEDGFSVRCLKD